MLYSRRNILEQIFMTAPEKDYFRRIPVWVAGYPNTPDNYDEIPSFYIPDQTRFGAPMLWQYSEAGVVCGIVGDVDLNWISPTFTQILGGTVLPQEEEIMTARYEATSTFGMAMRSTHQVSTTPPLGYIPANSRIHGDTLWTAPGERWLLITDVNGQPPKDAAGNVLAVPCWVAVEAAGRTYCALMEINPPVVEAETIPGDLWIGATKETVALYRKV
jgi:hypothetical protein